MTKSLSYAAAGVDLKAGDRAVELMKVSIALARRKEMIGGIGGFAGPGRGQWGHRRYGQCCYPGR